MTSTHPIHPIHDVVLGPGDFHFGQGSYAVRTLLGSCVAITLWHPRAHIGGMCHFVLPTRAPRRGHVTDREQPDTLDGKFGDEAVLMFLNAIDRSGTYARDYDVKVFGGGHQFPALPRARDIDIPQRNVEAARTLCASYGLNVVKVHVGRCGSRQVVLDLGSGDVWLRHSTTTVGI